VGRAAHDRQLAPFLEERGERPSVVLVGLLKQSRRAAEPIDDGESFAGREGRRSL
jgi:hypothetical protein